MAQVYRIQKTSVFDFLSMNAILILLNVICFIVFSILLWQNVIPIDYVALNPSNVVQGKFLWTFLTSMFMHGGFFHLFANMLSMLFIGGLVERILGKKRYLWFYLVSGLTAGLIFVGLVFLFPADMNSYAVGASGALFALVGFLMIITPNLPVYVMFIPIPVKMKYAGPGILVLLWLISVAANLPVGNTAHFGGLVAGLIYGIYIKNKYKNKTRYISKYFS